MFALDEKLSACSFKIMDLTLSEVRLKNNKNYPWIIVIPRVEKNQTEIFELSVDQQMQLMHEITHISQHMKIFFHPYKINIGALGNSVPQLHIHIIARFQDDLLWPHSVWQEKLQENPYTDDEHEKLIQQLRVIFT
jgi:diadenosine tetraphosphate (Ap4A) HIT family hydrolase